MSLGNRTVRDRVALDGALIGAAYLLATAYRLADLEILARSELWPSMAPVLPFVVLTHLAALALAGEYGRRRAGSRNWIDAGRSTLANVGAVVFILVSVITVRSAYEVFVAPLSALLIGGFLTCVVLGMAKLWEHRVVEEAPSP